MGKITNYKTAQKQAITDYIKSLNGQYFSVKDILNNFQSLNIQIGTATIYRYIQCLVESGHIRKYTLGAKEAACFQEVLDTPSCNQHFHLKCSKCGGLTHLECDFLNNIYFHIFETHKFNVNMNRTIFYGVCSHCLE